MSKIERFEDLKVWQDSFELSIKLYKNLSNCRDYALKDQICRASVSIASNIAEGFERNSNREFVRFLKIAKGSSGELRTQIYIAIEISILDKDFGNEVVEKLIEISKMLQKLISYREDLERKRKM